MDLSEGDKLDERAGGGEREAREQHEEHAAHRRHGESRRLLLLLGARTHRLLAPPARLEAQQFATLAEPHQLHRQRRLPRRPYRRTLLEFNRLNITAMCTRRSRKEKQIETGHVPFRSPKSYDLESSSEPTCMRLQCLLVLYSIIELSMRNANGGPRSSPACTRRRPSFESVITTRSTDAFARASQTTLVGCIVIFSVGLILIYLCLLPSSHATGGEASGARCFL